MFRPSRRGIRSRPFHRAHNARRCSFMACGRCIRCGPAVRNPSARYRASRWRLRFAVPLVSVSVWCGALKPDKNGGRRISQPRDCRLVATGAAGKSCRVVTAGALLLASSASDSRSHRIHTERGSRVCVSSACRAGLLNARCLCLSGRWWRSNTGCCSHGDRRSVSKSTEGVVAVQQNPVSLGGLRTFTPPRWTLRRRR